MRKQELVNRIAKRANINSEQAKAIANEILDAFSYALKKGDTFGGIKTSILKTKAATKKLGYKTKTKTK